jgi:hypothetical protein
VKKKPPMYRNKIEPVNNPHAKPIVALTNSNITNTTHLSTNEERASEILLTVFSTQKCSCVLELRETLRYLEHY